MTSLDKAPVEDVLLSRIVVGWRLRVKPRVTAAFRKSITERGLIHPIVIRPNGEEGRYELISGERRLETFRELGRLKIPARIVDVDDEELRKLELQENIQRLDLDSYEQSAQRLREWELEEEAETEEEETRTESVQVSGKRGPKPKRGSKRSLARAAGVPSTQVQETRDHVEAGKKYPFLKHEVIPKSLALALAKILDQLDPEARPTLVGLIDQEIPATKQRIRDAVELLGKKSPEEQRWIAKLWESNDEAEHGLAGTMVGDKPPMPDQCQQEIDVAIPLLNQALSHLKAGTRVAPPSMLSELKEDYKSTYAVFMQERDKWVAIGKRTQASHKERIKLLASGG